MIDEQSPASGHDYASNRWAIGAGVKLHVVLFLHMCSFWYKRPIYPLNYILKIPGILSDTRTFYYIYKNFLLVTNACVYT